MRVLVFGDSITQGFWDIDGGWVSRIRKHYDQLCIDGTDPDSPTIFNLGVSADSSSDVLARLAVETKARANQEVALVISVGVNDSRTKSGTNFSDPEQYKRNLAAILERAKEYSSKIMFVGLTPCAEERSNPVAWNDTGYTNDRIKEFDATLREFCTANSVAFIEVFEPFTNAQAKTELLPDGVHPNSEGHQLIATLVLPQLEVMLAS